ncbi:MAG: class II aldolase/adducin family protein [Planctomycetes bacterium]|nr:class II aldolase/adducin family protein [Planctomycetota bacterium]
MSLLNTYRTEVEAFVGVCRRLAGNRFVTSHGGNLATLLEEDVILITATCLAKGDHTPEDVVFIDRKGGRIEGKNRPTGEVPMYLTFFEERPDIKSVIHCHPPCCGAFAVADYDNLLERPVYPEICIEIGPVPVVPYATPLTQKLADNFKPFLPGHNAFLMENHGLVLLSPGDITWACHLVEELELAADSLLRAAPLGAVKEIPRESLVEMDGVLATRGLTICGAPGVNSGIASLYYPG